MKNIKYFILPVLLFFAVGCEDNNYLHQKYLDEGESIYMGMVDSIDAFPGNNRVKFTWQINADPRITKTVIYWNEYRDSAVVGLNRTQSGIIQVETVINVSEGSYIFNFVTKNNTGNRSLTVEKSVEVYGDRYAQSLRNRNIVKTDAIGRGKLEITWSSVETNIIRYTVVKYTDFSDPGNPAEREIKVENTEFLTVLTGVKAGETFTVTTVYQPEKGIDPVNTVSREYVIPQKTFVERFLDKSKFSAVGLPGDNTTVSNNRPMNLCWDGNYTNIWHTLDNPPAAYPICFTIDLGDEYQFSKMRLWARNGYYYRNHNIRDFEVFGSATLDRNAPNGYWTGNDWKNDWEQLGDFSVIKPSGSPMNTNTAEDIAFQDAGFEFSVPLTKQPVRYLRFVVKTTWSMGGAIHMAEFDFYGDTN